jgi:hypothetical protein
MSSITPVSGGGWTLDLTPGTVLTLTVPQTLKQRANVLVVQIPGITLAGDPLEDHGIATTEGALNQTPDPVPPTPNAAPGTAGAPGTPELTGPAIWVTTIRASEYKFLLSGAPGVVRVRVFLALDQATDVNATPAQPRGFRRQ